MHNEYSVTTIDAKSNVCCVKFKPDSQYNIVFGTADHNLYYFDLRNTRFLSNNEIVSASTDSQLRLWRVTEGQCLRTYRGHMNEKNFVGLAVSSGYIVCGMLTFIFFVIGRRLSILGSESNTVHLYQREISRPLLNYKFDDQNNGTVKTVTNTTVTEICFKNVCLLIVFN
jgi:E3 ubiquitin-protein ligase RFWD2